MLDVKRQGMESNILLYSALLCFLNIVMAFNIS